MQLKKTVRKAKHVGVEMIIGIDREVQVSRTNSSTRTKRVYRKVQGVVYDDVRDVRYFATRNGSGNLEFLKKNINDIVPIKVHPNTKEHKPRR